MNILIDCHIKNRRHLQIISILFAMLFVPVLVFAGQYQVIRIVDGDTIVINYQGKQEKVRLLCVDTPESVHPDKKQNIPMGKTASDYTKKRLTGKNVDLEFEGHRNRGNYGRLLAYVIVDGQNFNLELVQQGLSPYYTAYGLSEKYDQEFRDAEKSARKNGLNIWGDPELTEKYLRLKSKWGQKRSEIEKGQEQVEPAGQSDTGSYIGNKRSKKFHRPNCQSVKKMSPSNIVYLKSRDEAVSLGYVPCKICRP